MHAHAPTTLSPIAGDAGDWSWLDRAAYPFPSRFHSTAEGLIHYVDLGEGTPILFVHGTPSWSFEWRRMIIALSGRARTLAPDHLGFGLSDKPARAAYRPPDHARRLAGLVDALGLEDFVLVLHDFGVPIGLPLALDRPERIRHLVLLNGWAWPHGERASVRRISRFVRSPLGRWLYLGLNASPRWLLPASFADRRRLDPAVHRQYLGPFLRREDRRAPWVLGGELAGSDPYYGRLWAQRDRLRDVPLTIVWGERDPAFDRSYLARWCEAFPAARVIRLENAGHFPQEETPEAVIDAIREALRPRG